MRDIPLRELICTPRKVCSDCSRVVWSLIMYDRSTFKDVSIGAIGPPIHLHSQKDTHPCDTTQITVVWIRGINHGLSLIWLTQRKVFYHLQRLVRYILINEVCQSIWLPAICGGSSISYTDLPQRFVHCIAYLSIRCMGRLHYLTTA